MRRCWISPRPSGLLSKSWRRLVHDISHRVFNARSRSVRPHGGFHAKLEHEMAEYVIAKGWLSGNLKTVTVKPKPSLQDKLGHVEAAIKWWESKRKRAETALRKLRKKHRTLTRAA